MLFSTIGAIDFEPIVKIFSPDGNATWLLTELDPNGYLAFGLCDLGIGEPELGYVSLHELAAARGPLGLPLERDLHFAPVFDNQYVILYKNPYGKL